MAVKELDLFKELILDIVTNKKRREVMYIVKIKGSGTTVAICSRKEDAMSYVSSQNIDKVIYEIVEEKS